MIYYYKIAGKVRECIHPQNLRIKSNDKQMESFEGDSDSTWIETSAPLFLKRSVFVLSNNCDYRSSDF